LTKRILVVAHDRPLRESRVSLLRSQGYRVESVETDDDAMKQLEKEGFDLILLGRKSALTKKGIDQRLREMYPDLLTLKIEVAGLQESPYPSRITDSAPEHVLEAVRQMLGDDLHLVPLHVPVIPDYPAPST
jgi:hypothetical protein